MRACVRACVRTCVRGGEGWAGSCVYKSSLHTQPLDPMDAFFNVQLRNIFTG